MAELFQLEQLDKKKKKKFTIYLLSQKLHLSHTEECKRCDGLTETLQKRETRENHKSPK